MVRFGLRCAGLVTAVGLVVGCSGGGGGGNAVIPPANSAPVVSAGLDQTVFEGDFVTLSGSATDQDDTPIVQWTQLAGPDVVLAGAQTRVATFTAPAVATDVAFTFRLTASDGTNPAVIDDVVVTVRDLGVQVRQLNPDGISYADHEIHPARPEIVFQSSGEMFSIPLDPESGQLDNTTPPQRIDAVASLIEARNGPEYGQDENGVAIYYNKAASDGSLQFFRAVEEAGGSFTITPLTSDGPDRVNQLPSQDPDAPTTYLVYGREDPSAPFGAGWIAYLDVADPDVEIDVTPIRAGFSGFRWIRGTTQFLTTVADGPDEGQVLLVDAATDTQRVVTADAGTKFDPYGWYPPEFAGDLAIHATTNQTDITIYRDTGGTTFEPVAVLPPPVDTGPQFVQSPEPFVSEDGRSYISLTLKDVPGSIFTDVMESEIWLYGIEQGADRFTLRCDDGLLGRVRHEAETYSGDRQVFVYYNEIRPTGVIDLMLCETGLSP